MLKITLASARTNAGLTQKDVARELKVSNRTVGNWENYASFPTADQVRQLVSLYGIPYDNIKFCP